MRLLLESDKTFHGCKVWSERKDTLLVSTDGSYASAVWLPKDQITITPCLVRGRSGYAHVRMSQSLAADKGFIPAKPRKNRPSVLEAKKLLRVVHA